MRAVPDARRLLPLLLVTIVATPALAQSALTVGSGGAPLTAALHRGYPAYPATALRALGLAVDSGDEGARLVAFGDTIVLHTLSPFFTAGDALQHMAYPAYAEGGVVYLPHQFFAEWLPTRFAERLSFADGALLPRGAGGAVPGGASATEAGSGSEPLGRPAAQRPAPTARDLARVVVIDAGHGGRDSGARGPGGVAEKDVTLGIALRLAALLRGRDGYEVHLTRASDTLISLFDRPRLANGWKDGRAASLFVSIHANSSRDADVRGFETFILSEARTADERAVAERENAAASYDRRPDAPDQDEMAFILSDLRNEFYVHASHDLASLVQGEIRGFHAGPDRGVKQAPFVVLVGAYMPAILVETAFVSNASEARLLSSSGFQDRVAIALAGAIEEFFDTHAYLSAGEEP